MRRRTRILSLFTTVLLSTTYVQDAVADDAPPDQGPVAELKSDTAYTELQQRYGESWERICMAPCTAKLLPLGLYRVDAPGMTTSASFQPPVKSGSLKLDVLAGSAGVRTAGMIFASVGVSALLFSLVALPVAYSADNGQGSCSGVVDPGAACTARMFKTISFVSIAAGAAFIGLGIGLMVAGATDVRDETTGETFAKRSPRAPIRLTPQGFAF